MILIRISYSASLPSPADLLKEVKKKSSLIKKDILQKQQSKTASEPNISSDFTALENEDALIISSPQDLVKLLTAKRQMLLLYSIKNDVSFKNFEHGKIHITVTEKTDKT